MWSNPFFCLAFYACVFGLGEMVAQKTKGIVVHVLFTSIVFIIGYLTVIIPRDFPGNIGFIQFSVTYGMMILVVYIGTTMDVRELAKEWKTVVISGGSILVMGVIVYVSGVMFFNRPLTLAAIPSIAGGLVVAIMTADAARAAGNMTLASFAMLMISLQQLIGIPVSSFILRQYAKQVVGKGEHLSSKNNDSNGANAAASSRLQIIPPIPEAFNRPSVKLAKLTIVMLFSVLIAQATGNFIPATIVGLLLGVVMHSIGFLDRNILISAGMYNMIIFLLSTMIISNYSSLSLEALLSLIGPLIFFLLLGVVTLAAGGSATARLLKMD
jgi:hypothetical protein